MELTVLGKSNSWPDAGGACSGYLISESGFRLMLDCGTGALAALRRHCGYADVDAVVLSHLHADHILDLVPFGAALRYSERGPYSRVRLIGPPGTRALFGRLETALGLGDHFNSAFEISEYEPHLELELGPLSLAFCEVPHYVQTFAISLRADDGRRFTYGADCRYNRALIDFAAETELLLVEATLGDGEETTSSEAQLLAAFGEGHMTAFQAGRLARAAEAQRVLLSHFSDEFDPEALRRRAQSGFGADVELASEDLTLTV